jgi:DNA-binding SARP family transcriptional activator/predicted ATPase/tetratricopeptide (TPR) repeat protein
MAKLQLLTLGKFEAKANGRSIESFTSNKAKALFVFLAIEAHKAISRDKLATMFWPNQEEKKGKHSLRQALSNIKKSIEEEGADAIFEISRDKVAKASGNKDLFVDGLRFLELVASAEDHEHRRPTACIHCLTLFEEAADLYEGDFLYGFNVGGSEEFDEWLLIQREHFQQKAIWVFSHLAKILEAQQKFQIALDVTAKLSQLSPWDDVFQQQFMRLTFLTGNRKGALSSYQSFSNTLRKELDVEPSLETQVLADGIRQGTLIGQKHSVIDLPYQATEFVGREKEVALVDEFLQSTEKRLLTLSGIGGVGKTELAIYAAKRNAFGFGDGVYFLSAEHLTDENALVFRLAERINYQLSADSDLIQQLCNHLRGQEILLVLDNYESLLPEAELIIQLLKKTENLQILVTSRELLNLKSESVFEIEGLPYRDSGLAIDHEAGRLFLNVAERVESKFDEKVESSEWINRICVHLEGHPLGIELAGALTRDIAMEDIAAEISANMDFLATSMADVPEKHRSIRAVFDYSWKSLAKIQKPLFAKLSLFVGGFSLEAAQELLGASEDDLANFVNKSLIQELPNKRYRIHPLIRQFAQEYFDATVEKKTALTNSFVKYYGRFMDASVGDIKSRNQSETISLISLELENIDNAINISLARRDFVVLQEFLEALYLYYEIKGQVLVGAKKFDKILNELDKGKDNKDDLPEVFKVVFLPYRAFLQSRIGNTKEALAELENGLKVAKKLNLKAQIAFCLSKMGTINSNLGNTEKSQDLFREAITLYENEGMVWEESIARSNLGFSLSQYSEEEAAEEQLEKALELAKQTGDSWNLSAALNNLGVLSYTSDRFAEAIDYFEKSLEHHKAIGDIRGRAIALTNIGECQLALKDLDTGQSFIAQSILDFVESGNEWGLAYAHHSLSKIAIEKGEFLQARKQLADAMSKSLEHGLTTQWILCLCYEAKLLIVDEKFSDAISLLAFAKQQEAINLESEKLADELLGQVQDIFSTENYDIAFKKGEKLTTEGVKNSFTDNA